MKRLMENFCHGEVNLKFNFRCGANWQDEGGNGGTVVSTQFIEPRGVSFYRLHPNYFFYSGGGRRIRIHGGGFSSITVCQSRSAERPRYLKGEVNGTE